jgi:hypothetical protein
MLNSVKSSLGDTQAQAEAAAVQALRPQEMDLSALDHANRGHG